MRVLRAVQLSRAVTCIWSVGVGPSLSGTSIDVDVDKLLRATETRSATCVPLQMSYETNQG